MEHRFQQHVETRDEAIQQLQQRILRCESENDSLKDKLQQVVNNQVKHCTSSVFGYNYAIDTM